MLLLLLLCMLLLLLQVRESGVPAVIVRPCALTEEPAGAPLELDQGDVIKVRFKLWSVVGGRGFRCGQGRVLGVGSRVWLEQGVFGGVVVWDGVGWCTHACCDVFCALGVAAALAVVFVCHQLTVCCPGLSAAVLSSCCRLVVA